MPHGGVELVRGKLAPVFFKRSLILAERFSPKEAVIAGFLDKVVSEAEFVPRVQ
jgi:enoyl-CoA hydratase